MNASTWSRRTARHPYRAAVVSLVSCGLLASVAACTRIEEPWVMRSSQLEQERARSPAVEEALRERARLTQTDRRL